MKSAAICFKPAWTIGIGAVLGFYSKFVGAKETLQMVCFLVIFCGVEQI